jgi:xanthine dehydrogenase accessory factor
MANKHSHYALLEHYLSDVSGCEWALATVVNKEGSSYRSPGSIMMVNSLGQSFGLVSGGCLEADIVRRAKQVFYSANATYAEYDLREEDSFAAELGIGCKGKIGVLIQRFTEKHRVVLDVLYATLKAGGSCYLLQEFEAPMTSSGLNEIILLDSHGEQLASTVDQGKDQDQAEIIKGAEYIDQHQTFYAGDSRYSLSRIDAAFNFWIFGGGADAEPLASMASQLGWRVTVVDHRTAYARASAFKSAETIVKTRPEELDCAEGRPPIDGAMLMTHNLKLDAQWLAFLHKHSNPIYVGLLGPVERRERVLELCDVSDLDWLDNHVNGPVGLDLGGELPESIALSILAQCHAVLFGGSGEILNKRSYIRVKK